MNNRGVKRIFRKRNRNTTRGAARGGGGRNRSPREIERVRPINFYLAAGAEEM